MCDGINVVCYAENTRAVKVFYGALKSLQLPVRMFVDGIMIDPDSIEIDIMVVFRDLASKVGSFNKDMMLFLQRFTNVLRLPEAHLIEVMLIWIEEREPSEEDMMEVYRGVRWSVLCGGLEVDVVDHITTNRQSTVTRPEDRQYKYKSYWWQLSSDQLLQWCNEGQYNFCRSGYTRSIMKCKVDSCDSVTHPCYIIAIENGYYIVRDSLWCNEGGLQSWEDESREGEVGHQHRGSVSWCWAVFGRKVSSGEGSSGEWVCTYTSLLLHTKEVIDAKLAEWAALGGQVSISVMFDPAHVDRLQ